MKRFYFLFVIALSIYSAAPVLAQTPSELAEDFYQQGLSKYFNDADVKEAIRLFEQALEIMPEHEGALQELSARFNDEAQFESAERLSLRGTGIYPQNPNMYLNLGVAYAMQGKIPDAMTAYETALYLKPDFVVVLANYGAMHYELGNTFEARQALLKAQKLINAMPQEEKEGYAALSEEIEDYIRRLERDKELAAP